MQKKRETRIHIPWLLAIGILVQFGWEAGLLLGGVRSAGFASMADKFAPLMVNSLLETNLGMPYIYFIFIAISRKYCENLKRRKHALSFTGRLAENNLETVRGDGVGEYLV